MWHNDLKYFAWRRRKKYKKQNCLSRNRQRMKERQRKKIFFYILTRIPCQYQFDGSVQREEKKSEQRFYNFISINVFLVGCLCMFPRLHMNHSLSLLFSWCYTLKQPSMYPKAKKQAGCSPFRWNHIHKAMITFASSFLLLFTLLTCHIHWYHVCVSC